MGGREGNDCYHGNDNGTHGKSKKHGEMEKKEKKLIEKEKSRNGLDNIKIEFVKIHSTSNEVIT